MKDEIGTSEEEFTEDPEKNVAEEKNDEKDDSNNTDDESLVRWEENASSPEEIIKKKLSGIIDVDTDIISIEVDTSFSDLIEQSNALGEFFELGNLTAGYFDKNDSGNTIIITNENGSCIELVVGKKCSPDRIIKELI